MYSYYPEELIEEIRINNDIEDVVSEYVKMEKKGKDYFGLCPFHKEKTPSFSVSPSKQIFYCFGCGKGGNVFHFIMSIENLGFIDAVKLLADRAKIQLPEEGSREEVEKARLKKEILDINTEAARFFFNNLNSSRGKEARNYLGKRAISSNTIKKFGLGYSIKEWDGLYKYLKSKGYSEDAIVKSGLVLPRKSGGCYDRFRNRIIFPIFNIRGNVIGFGGRVMDSSLPKYVNSPETIVYNKSKSLYALNFAKNSNEKRLLVVEGYMDVISLHQSGIINTVAPLGTALTESQGRLLKKYADEIIIAYDSDAAGQSATMRSLSLLDDIGCNVKILVIPDRKDPDGFVRKNGADAFKKLVESAVSLVEYKIKKLREQINTETTDGKIRFLNRVSDILSKIDNNVEREMYIKKMAGEYEITEESLYSEVYRRIKRKNGFKPTALYTNKFRKLKKESFREIQEEKHVNDERFLLALLCKDNSVYKLVKDKINIEFFTDPENRRIASVILHKLENKEGIEPAELLNMVDSGKAGFFSKIFGEESHFDDINRTIMGKIRNIELYRNEKRIKDISELLQNKDSLTEGDVEKLESEIKSLALLIKKQKST
jgi:DNA primase